MPEVNPTVLYVEDEEMDRFFMARAFAKEGLASALHMVNDGQGAIDYLSGAGEYADREKHPMPAVVLLDLNLPEIHGFEVLKWIRAQPTHSRLPVVVFSSSERDDDQVRASILGAKEFVKKPGSGLGFHDVVRKLNERWLKAAGEGSMTVAEPLNEHLPGPAGL
jgi:CheY-like chemotaxis protein